MDSKEEEVVEETVVETPEEVVNCDSVYATPEETELSPEVTPEEPIA